MQQKKLNFFSIITTGRTGSDYLEACINGLSTVLTIPDKIYFYKFCNKFKINKNQKIKKKKFLKKFVKNNKNFFNGSKLENKFYSINKNKFINLFNKNYKETFITRDQFLINLYLSYSLYLKENIKKKINLIYHAHHFDENQYFLDDFKHVKIFITIRDPRQNLYSGIYNWRKYQKNRNTQQFNFNYLKRVIEDLNRALKLPNKKIFIKLEEANDIKIKKKISNFLKNKFEKKIFYATYFTEKKWTGDKLSTFKSKGLFNVNIKKKIWQNSFSLHDIKLLNFLFKNYKKFNYDMSNKYTIAQLFLFSWRPFSFEVSTFVYSLKNESILKIFKNFFWYIIRTMYIYKKILKFFLFKI